MWIRVDERTILNTDHIAAVDKRQSDNKMVITLNDAVSFTVMKSFKDRVWDYFNSMAMARDPEAPTSFAA